MAFNLSSSTPTATDGKTNVAWQKDGSENVSAQVIAGGKGVTTKTADYAVLGTDGSYLLAMNSGSAHTFTLPNPAPFAGWFVRFQNVGAGACAIARNSLTIDGAASNLSLSQNQGLDVFSDGTNYWTMRGAGTGGGLTSPLTTKGDVWGYSTTDARIPIGSNGQVLTADSTQTLGVKWAATGSGGAPTAYCQGVPGNISWLAADAITGLSDGNNVVTWPDAARPGVAASGQTSSAYPIYKTNIVNGKPVVRFGGSGWLKNFIPNQIDQQFSVFMVLSPSSLSNAYSGIVFADWTADAGGYFLKSNGKTAWYISGATALYDGTGSATLSTGTFYVISIIWGPNVWGTRVALAADASGTAANTTNGYTQRCYIGNHSTGSRVFSGDLAEFIVFGQALSNTDRDTIEGYLKTKYGL